jgi:hypothetical protein
MQTFNALSYGDKWRVSRCLARGEAPRDPRMAVAAVELAEDYQRQSRAFRGLARWLPVILVVVATCITVSSAIEGDHLTLILNVLLALGGVGQLLFNPAARPKNTARSLEASRRVVEAQAEVLR